MNLRDVPPELVDKLIRTYEDIVIVNTDLSEMVAREILVAVLPAFREQIAKEIEAHGEALMAQAIEQVLADKEQGFSSTFRAAAVTSVAKIVRGES